MTSERWRQIETLFHKVYSQPEEERRELLAQADDEIRREVEALLKCDGSLPALSDSITREPLTPGATLGPYRIEHQIGSGGMGTVFRAFDTRLNRAVAIKVVGEFDARLEREARTIAQLNHPHICVLHDVGPGYLVMEMLEGETLAARLKQGKLAAADVFQFGAQIADALAAAHAKGIVHRDLKPANIFITPKVGIKVLDFGIARSPQDETITAALVVIGTPAYMAPEQKRGIRCDGRSDIYSFGLILREMATGSRDGDLSGISPALAHIITGCLEEAPDERWQSAIDIRRELEWARTMASVGLPSEVRAKSAYLWPVLGVAIVVLLVSGFLFYGRRPNLSTVPPSRFVLDLRTSIEPVDLPVPSPNGRILAFQAIDSSGAPAVWIRPLDSVSARKLAGTDGADGDLTWSPDGNWIAFYTSGKLKKVRPSGGVPETIGVVSGFQDAAWGPGDIIFRPNNRLPLSRLRISSGSIEPLTKLNPKLDENSHRFPTFLPDGRHFLYVSRCNDRVNNAVYLASLDSPEVTRIMAAQGRVSYIPGALVFYQDGAVMARKFNPKDGKLSGEPVQIIDDVAYNAPSINAGFRVSGGGELLINESAGGSGGLISWYGRDGQKMENLATAGSYMQIRLSPDGQRLAYVSPDPQSGNRDVWSTEISRGITTRLTNNPANDWFPVWSPDGKQLAFASDRQSGPVMRTYLKKSLDPEAEETLVKTNISTGQSVTDWSEDGKWFLFGPNDVIVAPVSKPEAQFPFVRTKATESAARFSPDGQWIAFASNESGEFEVYVAPFHEAPATRSEILRISVSSGVFPVWSRAGDELYYMSVDGSIYAVDMKNVAIGGPLRPERLFRACTDSGLVYSPTSTPYAHPYDTLDGKKFAVLCRVQPPGRSTVMLNVPTPK